MSDARDIPVGKKNKNPILHGVYILVDGKRQWIIH